MALGTFISGLTGLFGSRQQIDAQRKENQETREYNLNLARLQNKWNIDQWHRENVYNSPAAQMARFAAAGLNPNLIYGQTNTAPQLSGSMSSGAPASPTDLSAMGKSTEAMSKMFGSFGDALMQLPMYREQLRSMKLDNDNKQFELGFQEFIHKNKYDPLGITEALKGQLTPAQRKYLQGLRNDIAQGDSIIADVDAKQLENAFNSKVFNDQVEKIASEAKISKENADYLAKSAVYRLNSDKFQSELRELEMLYQQNKNKWMDWDRWINHGINAAHAIGDVLALKNLLSIFGVGKGKGVLESGGKGNWKKTGDNTFEWIGN